ncbi:hypothetical protein FEM48_Zijuj05G0068000 [Ziziphus jujuba var. spinosa]|uniref:Uncharacterized protein n=1 Tax=Ziziphus jujuba var. spinosa TaxID=714518 RepID=A0A978VDF8_ZIZJJ|nr:hypothetical protein FEM48_Zijuj05G0068000 [Ziziphus jujuba var. spinosa]
MKKKAGQLEGDEQQKQVEILKAVAQAWHSHSGSSRPMNEFDAHRRNFNGKPSRFKIEAMGKRAAERNGSCGTWDFKQSLWDSYEIVTMSKRLEAGLVFDNIPFTEADAHPQVFCIEQMVTSKMHYCFTVV